MTHLLREDVANIRSDVGVLKSDVGELKLDVKAINRNLITGLIVIVASMVGVVFAAL